MFQKGEFIMYGNTGVCRVEEVGAPPHVASVSEKRDYYKLSPVFGKETIYTPVDSAVFMRAVLTKDEALDLVSKIPDIAEDNFESRDQRMLQEHYKDCLKTHNCADLVQLIKSVHAKNRAVVERGKNPGKTDVQYLKLAQELLHGELSVALDMPMDQVPELIRQKVEGGEELEKGA